MQSKPNFPFHYRVMPRLTRRWMSHRTPKVFTHCLQCVVLIAIHHRSILIRTGRETEKAKVVIRLSELKRAKRHEPPIIRVYPVKDSGIFETANTERLVYFCDGKLIHRDGTRPVVLPLERTTIMGFIHCMCITSFALSVVRSMQHTMRFASGKKRSPRIHHTCKFQW